MKKKNKLLCTIFLFSLISSFVNAKSIIKVEIIANNCNGCHGSQGLGNEFMPSIINGNKDQFISKMNYYKFINDGSIMNRILDALSDDDILNLAKHYFKDKNDKK